MKNKYKYLLLAIIASTTFYYSCETLELEMLVDPNALSDNQANPDLLLNAIQLNYLSAITSLNNNSENLSRLGQFRGATYFDGLGSGTLNGAWENLYSGIIPDIANLQALHDNPNIERDLSFHLGIAKTMQAHLMMLLVDFLGDIVYSQANNPTEFPLPELDDDEDVYNAAFELLGEAKENLNDALAETAADFYYDGDTIKWIKFANTLKMRFNLTVGNYSEVISATNVLDNNDDDLAFKYGTNAFSPDTRHPDYAADYTPSGAGNYRSNWLMDLMVGEFGDLSDDTDPRRRYYFYRQKWRAPVNYAIFEDVLGLIGPVYQAGTVYISYDDSDNCYGLPAHLEFTPDENTWCFLHLGYWGRMHGNGGGIPPDNFNRTAIGVYPAAGSFDATPDAFPYVGDFPDIGQQVSLGSGGAGAGIEPIMLASFVDFMKAEANLHLGNTGLAATHFEAGITKSIDKVMGFGALDAGTDMSQAPNATTVSDFIADRVTEFNAASMSSGVDGFGFPIEKDKMDLLGEQYFIAMYGGGADAFNFIRRTGYPRALQRHMAEFTGPFPRTFLYPSSEASPNPNIIQRTDNNTLVFWDNGILNPAN